MLNRLSVRSKLVLMLLLVSLLSTVVVGLIAWWNSRAALTATLFNELLITRKATAEELRTYFADQRQQILTLSEDGDVVEAMVRFNRAYRQLETTLIAEEWEQALESYYTTQFLPRLFENLPGQADYELYRPNSQAARYLQYQYIVNNPHPVGEKLLLTAAEDGSEYSTVHARYHPDLVALARRFGYYDILLINLNTADIVYTTSKEVDYATNLNNGPYRNSNLAAVVQAIINNPAPGSVELVDFDLYRPSYAAPAAFWAAPIFNGSHPIGVLAVQMSSAGINQITTHNQSWQQAGLGQSGETYVVGSDLLLRSDSRFLIENPQGYAAFLRERGIPERTVNLVEWLGTTVLLQRVASPADEAAVQGQEDTRLADDYRGVPALVSYEPFTVETLQWGLVAKMDQTEAFQPIYDLQNQLLIAAVLVITLLAFAAIAIAHFFVHPINRLAENARKASAGDYNLNPGFSTHDEVGQLAKMVEVMAGQLQKQDQQLAAKDQTVRRLLLNLLPGGIANRVQNGESSFVDEAQQVTVLYATIGGFQEWVTNGQSHLQLEFLNEVTSDLAEAADRYEVEKLSIMGGRLVAICGLSTPHLDHAQRVLNFVLAAERMIQRLNTKHDARLTLAGGMHAGAVMAGVAGSDKLIFELWGDPVRVATALQAEAHPGTILASTPIKDRLQEIADFTRHRSIHVPAIGPMESWSLALSAAVAREPTAEPVLAGRT
jgi:class 3 adenylate cyclase